MPYYRTAAHPKDDNTRELVIQADTKEEAWAKIPQAKTFLFPQENSESYFAYASPFPLTVNVGTTITYYRITVHRPTEKERTEEHLSTEDVMEDSDFYEWIIEAKNTDDAKAQMYKSLEELGKCPDDFRIYTDEMSLEDCIKEEERTIEHRIKRLYYKSFGYFAKPIREMTTYDKEMSERGELYYKAVKFANRVLMLFEHLDKQVDLSKINAKQYKEYIIRLAKAESDKEFEQILNELKGE